FPHKRAEGEENIGKRRSIATSFAALGIVALFAGVFLSSEAGVEWRVSEEGLLDYRRPAPEYRLISSEEAGASSLQELRFSSRGLEVAALLREPSAQRPEGFPGVVLLPGATVTK